MNENDSLEFFKLVAEENQNVAKLAEDEKKRMRQQFDRQLANFNSQLDQMKISFENDTKNLQEENELLS